MTKNDLIGVWGSDIYGVMEIEMIAFAANGSGWWAYARHVLLSRGTFMWSLEGEQLRLVHSTESNANLSEEGDIVGVFEETPYVAETDYTFNLSEGHWRSYDKPHTVLVLAPSPVVEAMQFAPLPRLTPTEPPRFERI